MSFSNLVSPKDLSRAIFVILDFCFSSSHHCLAPSDECNQQIVLGWNPILPFPDIWPGASHFSLAHFPCQVEMMIPISQGYEELLVLINLIPGCLYYFIIHIAVITPCCIFNLHVVLPQSGNPWGWALVPISPGVQGLVYTQNQRGIHISER